MSARYQAHKQVARAVYGADQFIVGGAGPGRRFRC
jgi:hypothetical protein